MSDGIAGPEAATGMCFSGIRHPQVLRIIPQSSYQFSCVWGGVWLLWAQSLEGFISPFMGWVAPSWHPAAWALGISIPHWTLWKTAIGQRLPTDLHNCTVP